MRTMRDSMMLNPVEVAAAAKLAERRIADRHQPYTDAPEMDGTASAGSSEAYARGDHVHPSDTSRAAAESVAAAFDAAASYAVGDYCTLGGVLYRCNAAHTGAWNVLHFTAVTVIDELAMRVPVYGMGKNLIDNAYFVGGGSQQGRGQFPINQNEGYVVPSGYEYWDKLTAERIGTTEQYYIASNQRYLPKF